MGDPNQPQVNVPATTPGLGAVLGGIAAAAVSAKVGNPLVQYAASAIIPGLAAALAHWLHSKLGTPE